MKFRKIYIEITNICNLSCEFCHKTKREKRHIDVAKFYEVCEKVRPYTDYIYLHLMGEPLCHPHFHDILKTASDAGFKICITTNGTLLESRKEDILFFADSIYKISVSLHSFEGNGERDFLPYYNTVTDFIKESSRKGIISVTRLWNVGAGNPGNKFNEKAQDMLHEAFGGEWSDTRYGPKMGNNVYLEYGDRFIWPDTDNEEIGESRFCMGLRDQIGILCDGTVVPCCLDADGAIALGNIFQSGLDEIVTSPRAKNIYNGFSENIVKEALCRRCAAGRMKRNGGK